MKEGTNDKQKNLNHQRWTLKTDLQTETLNVEFEKLKSNSQTNTLDKRT